MYFPIDQFIESLLNKSTNLFEQYILYMDYMCVYVQCEGQRNKLVACDGNEIDTMFVDRRKDGGQAGKTLVRM